MLESLRKFFLVSCYELKKKIRKFSKHNPNNLYRCLLSRKKLIFPGIHFIYLFYEGIVFHWIRHRFSLSSPTLLIPLCNVIMSAAIEARRHDIGVKVLESEWHNTYRGNFWLKIWLKKMFMENSELEFSQSSSICHRISAC